jgi:hypothetical protein
LDLCPWPFAESTASSALLPVQRFLGRRSLGEGGNVLTVPKTFLPRWSKFSEGKGKGGKNERKSKYETAHPS